MEFELRDYEGPDGECYFRNWFDGLQTVAKYKVYTNISRLALGNFSNVKTVGSGVFELKIDFGSGFRVYFGQDGKKLVILLCGGTKKRQQNDIENAKEFWADYKKRKKEIENGAN